MTYPGCRTLTCRRHYGMSGKTAIRRTDTRSRPPHACRRNFVPGNTKTPPRPRDCSSGAGAALVPAAPAARRAVRRLIEWCTSPDRELVRVNYLG
jgi:hypothetical protein